MLWNLRQGVIVRLLARIFFTVSLLVSIPAISAPDKPPIRLCVPLLAENGLPLMDRSTDPSLGQYHPHTSEGYHRMYITQAPEDEETQRLKFYFQNSPEIKRSLELLYYARKIRYHCLKKGAIPGLKKPDPLAVDQARRLIQTPLLMLIKRPMENYPFCMLRISSILIKEDMQKRVADELAPEVLVIVPFGTYSFESMMANDLLDLLCSHEIAHAAMFEAYGAVFDAMSQTKKSVSHYFDSITTGQYALIEGWAEAVCAWVDPAGKLRKKAAAEAKKALKTDYYFDANDKLRQDHFIWIDPKKKDGRLKNGSQILATEGIVASILFQLLSNRKLIQPEEKILTLMATQQPRDLRALIRAWTQKYPNEAETILRIVLETTRYACMDRQVAKAYTAYRAARNAFISRKGSKKAFMEAKRYYEGRKEKAFQAALHGEDPFAATGPQLEFYGPGYFGDLNLVDAKTLVNECGLDPEDAEKIIEAREKTGYFAGTAMGNIIHTIGEATWQKKYSKMYWQNAD